MHARLAVPTRIANSDCSAVLHHPLPTRSSPYGLQPAVQGSAAHAPGVTLAVSPMTIATAIAASAGGGTSSSLRWARENGVLSS